MRRWVRSVIAVAAVVWAGATAEAAVQTRAMIGKVETVADPSLTLLVGGTVFTEIRWDERAIHAPDGFTPAGIDGFVPLGADGSSLFIAFPHLLVIDQTSDFDFRGGSFPRLNFIGGKPVGIDLVTRSQFLFGSAVLLALSVDTSSWRFTVVDRSGTLKASGTLNLVPLPGALPLLGSAVLVLAYLRRRRRSPR
jgi:hypothetical protein